MKCKHFWHKSTLLLLNITKALKVITIFTLGVTLSTFTYADVILHAFNWKYSEVTKKAQEISDLGYKKVLVSPAYKSTGSEWWARYQPQDLRLIDSPLGNTLDFKEMIDTLKSKNIEVYADIVLNHMANESYIRNDLNYPGQAILNDYSKNIDHVNTLKLFGDLTENYLSSNDFHPAGCITNWGDAGHVQYWRLCGGDGDTGLPDLDPNNWVVEQQKSYLKALKNMGVTGFRVDAAKHMSNYHINSVFNDEIKKDMHIFGEIITSGGSGNGSFDNFLAPYLNDTDHGAYDFPLFSSLRSALGYGGSMNQLVNPGAYGQALPSSKAITFSITHDIPTNVGFRYQIMDPVDEKLANAYILGRDGGVPMIYSDHNESNDNKRWQDYYKRNDITAMVKFHNQLKNHTMQVIAFSDCILLFKRDHAGIVGINKCNNDQDVWVDTATHNLYWYRNYRDVLNTSDVQYVKTQWHKFTIPSRNAKMWLME
ncbi:alpha-amylase [Pseudoalteromonas sp. NBT06-2]|uniref:alpha-amylase family protein n=1 Tax=Pseudoalteromonas sp. NBT06-2 TaxID=2025950 RepID=UPI000BA72189|nr:alpha-amylase family protein [Pseudoalteromonas sp. NBT06-2]PAJ76302.1 alpha-amylase [Pseudoalteromonas sp. NBT06-2]